MKLLILALSILLSVNSFAEGYFGIELGSNSIMGFYGGNFPEEGQLGFYIDIKGTLGGPEDNQIYEFTSEYAKNSLGDSQTGTEEEWTIINIAASFPVYENQLIFVGAGLGQKDTFDQFHDPTGILGTGNTYYTKGEKETSMNLTFGAILNYKKLNFKIAYDTFPQSLHFGVGISF